MGNKKPDLRKPNSEHTLIGIHFPDNDFGATLKAFLGLFFYNAVKFDDDEESFDDHHVSAVVRHKNVTKARIVELFNSLAPGLYWLCQNGYRYNLEEDHKNSMEKYLKIKEEDVYLGQECLTHYEERKGWDNGEFHFVDIQQKKVFTF